MSGTTMVILSAFVAYLLLMIVIGVVYMKKTSSSEDYFLGGRGLNAWVAALSAQASDMSGWLLMGLPGAIYSLGTGQIWIAVGLFIGTVLNWVCISHRLRKYTIAANNSLTIPAFLENRFQDKKRILLLLSSIVIVIFFLVYTASALAAGGKLFNTVFGIDYHIALAIGAAVILCYTFMGGFMAVCVTDFVQGTLMLIGLLIVPLVAYLTLSGSLQPVRLSSLLFSEKNSDFFCVQRDRMVSKQFPVLHGTDNVHIWAADRNHLFFHPGFFHHSCNLLPSVPVLLFIGALPEINNDL